MRISEVAARARVNVQTLRYYERRGLLPEPERTPSGYRDYGSLAIRMVRFIKRAQELGFTLDEAERLLRLAEAGPEQCDAARAVATDRLADIATRIADLQRMQAALEELIATCADPRPSCPILDALEPSGVDDD